MKPKSNARDWYEIRNEADDAEVYIYGYIGSDPWDEDAVSAKEFIDAIRAYDAKPLTVRINSGGGSVFDGIAIHTAIKNRKAPTNVYVDALAASAASIIAMAGDTITMAAGSFLMIHRAWGMAVGNCQEMREMADTLDKLDNSLVTIYEARTGQEPAGIKAAMDAETWYTAGEAVALGYADSVAEEMAIAACVDEDTIQQYVNAPAAIKADAAANDTFENIAEESEPAAPGVVGEQVQEDVPPVDMYVALESGIYKIN